MVYAEMTQDSDKERGSDRESESFAFLFVHGHSCGVGDLRSVGPWQVSLQIARLRSGDPREVGADFSLVVVIKFAP